MHDYVASLYRPGGEVLCAGESLAFHVACADFAVKRIIEWLYGDDTIDPDDVFLLNDPYLAAIHQSDMCMILPIRYGTDSVGNLLSFPLSCHNVERAELNFPLLYLFRRHNVDGGRPGQYRGSTGVETAVTVHDAPEGRIRGIAFGVVGLTNSGRGIFAGYPGAPSVTYLVQKHFASKSPRPSRWPQDLAILGGEKRSEQL